MSIAETLEHVVFPGDATYDEARRAWNLAVDQAPAAVSLPRNAREIAEAVCFAAAGGLRVAMQSTGHNAAPLGDLSDTLLVKTHNMRGVRIDAASRIARVQAGAQWQDDTPTAAEHGLAALAGSAHDVGVAGYMLGGGISWLARRHGLASDSVRAIEVVTAAGDHLRVDARRDADLFWALRGGGGAFAAVTALELELLSFATVHAGALFFPIERAREVLQAWREWTLHVADTVTSVGRVMQTPGGSFALIEAVFSEGIGDESLRPLRALGPARDTFAQIPMTKLVELHMDPPGPVPGHSDHQLLRELPAAAVDAVAQLVPGSPLMSFEFRHLGGALRRPAPNAGALASIDAAYATFGVGTPAPGTDEAFSAIRQALAPHDAGRDYLNFSDDPAAEKFDPQTLARLRAVKAAYDPEDLFRSNHPLG